MTKTNLHIFLEKYGDETMVSCDLCEPLFGPCSARCKTWKEIFSFLGSEAIEIPELTEEEKTILRLINPKYNYIVRDPDDESLWLTVGQPKLKTGNDTCYWIVDGEHMSEFSCFNHRFTTIKDDTVYKISDLLKQEK